MYHRLTHFLAAILFATLVGARTRSRSPLEHASRRASRAYTLQDRFSGQDFLSKWYFFVGSDPTNGYVNFVSMQDARNQGLAYVDGNNAFVLAVDSTNYLPSGGYRNSTRITSYSSYNGGLFILDAAAMPVGCGTWPSFWTNGPNWPHSGEIDIIEGVNNQPYNQMTLHSGTSQACTVDTAAGGFSGHVLNPQCYSTQNADAGCSIQNPGTNSFGYGFNNAQGGVFALLWDTTNGMSMWHWPRSSIPADINNQHPTPANWGTPAGFWSAKTCDISANFHDHSMIIDTTICGGWPNSAYPNSGCPGTCAEAVADPKNFANAKWVINYIAVYQ